MSKHKISPVKQKAIRALKTAFDLLEGEYSNIPECCIEGFLNGRTYMNVRNSLESEALQEKLYKWTYVPCKKCFKNNKKNKIKMNGTSHTGKLIRTLISIIQDEKNLL